MLSLQSQLYLTTANTRKGKPIEYGGKDVPIFKNHRQLKDFQVESLNWLVSNWHDNRNCILADEMGLGKTVQTIAFLHHLKEREGLLGPFLVLSPLTTLLQWRREVEDWTNFNCLLYYDGQSSSRRDVIQEHEFYHMHTSKSGEVVPSEIPKFQVLLTSYETFMIDFDVLKRIPFQHVILDEAHRLKNSSSKLTSSLRKLPCTRKTLLTGTPIQNNTKELWTLLNFIAPDHFQSDAHFMQTFGSLSTDEQVRAFKRLLKPYLLRRVKEEVETTIPRLSEIIIDVEMTSCQKTYYRGILEKNKTTVLKSLASANFNSIAIQLRKCCNHPYLISADIEEEVLDSQRESGKTNRLEGFVRASGKMVLLMKLLAKFKR